MKILTTPFFLFFVCAGLISVTANAQKLPKVQVASLRAPANIKIDGKTSEWNGKFQAYNPNNRLYYTISNDEENLYLLVQSSDGYSGEKALYGIKFTVKVPADKDGRPKESIAITFPEHSDLANTQKIINTIGSVRYLNDDTTNAAQKKKDSLQLFANNLIGITYKEIIVEGIKDIPNPVVALYNTDGIKAAAQFNSPMRYTYELAIPLKYLGSMINNGQKFDYNIKMLARPEVSSNGIALPRVEMVSFPGGEASGSGNDNYFASNQGFIVLATDFSGTYTLAKN